ncbi:hypothetical protein F5X99DRAFT_404485 [Biscogniauxia marginata]|nr:hypothetical protein F5X99DRAFT_404485 [Biscogniauxia marginata]
MAKHISSLRVCFLGSLLFPGSVSGIPHSSLGHEGLNHREQQQNQICRREVSMFDYSAKNQSDKEIPICSQAGDTSEASIELSSLFARQVVNDDDFSCAPDRPCRNGACCPKATLYCNYGEEYCGTNGQSPNEVCWSNCDAKAECGENADPPGKKCPLNYGFCGTTADFCGDGCQSNCDKPEPGGSESDIQKKVIGYYEAWAHDRDCQDMDFNKIPVGALTHLYFSFAYITPGDFNIAPMDDLDPDLFSKFTDVKRKNSGLKTVVALGGWTFNDPGPFQNVFSDLVSTKENRGRFIENLFAFMREFAFDGVDFDWEYPGADDRGGKENDGANFVTFLKELNDYNKKQPNHYTVSFTAPTSYWYLKHFDLKAADYVDYINVMSYDLHGIWDRDNPIGNNVLAHTNLTEIKMAFELFWRNKVPPKKLNIGFGFYGRSFQLSDPSCHKPGCKFKGGASPGPCSKNSGTLTYREIQQIIKDNDLEPYNLKEEAVKYITWNGDQWVSYDDEETFQAKIEWANGIGLGGMLIWAIDQDTDDLQALSGLLKPKSLKEFQKQGDDAAYWGDATVPSCYVTDCGGKCKTGFVKVTTQPCGSRDWKYQATEDDSQLCCPIQGAPNKDDCTWRGGSDVVATSCNGHCHDDEVTMELNRWGDHSQYCFDGNKAYCCKSPLAQENKCYWAEVGAKCNGDDVAMTFSGTFLSTLADIVGAISKIFGRAVPLVGIIGTGLYAVLEILDMELNKYYCCPKEDAENWQDCDWYGNTDSSDTCFDNHCPADGNSVQLTDSPYGLGESCAPRFERTRVFCCKPKNGKSPFLPVPLANLFENPPTGDNVDTEYDLNIDDTWGTGESLTNDDGDDPGDAAFNFYVMASPEEIQISMDKRDGSHWDILNCHETNQVSEAPQTVQMVCTDVSENSNCYKIGLGKGVPGTILQMPPRCGPGKYAVAVSMVPAVNQIFPSRLKKRLSHSPVLYNLTFDYDFTRVPRDLGETQLRVDFSNQENYWDEVVAAAVSKRKTKRQLSDEKYRGNHRRWLEDEFRDDFHGALISRDELHKRWFGQGIIAWLTQMLKPSISREFRHEINKDYSIKILDDEVHCSEGDTQFDAYIRATATTSVEVSTSFGMTLTAVFTNDANRPLDITGSYLTFYNEGHISAILHLEALASVHYSKRQRIVNVPFPGASFSIPGVATIGPQLNIYGQVDIGLTASAEFETTIDIASWEIRQTLPDTDSDHDPKEVDDADYKDTGSWTGIQKPQVYAGILAEGDASAHLQASVDFGVTFQDRWKIDDVRASVVADGWLMVKMAAGKSTVADCPFTYGLEVGADMYAEVVSPSIFGWSGTKFDLPSPKPKTLIDGGTCPDLKSGNPFRRRWNPLSSSNSNNATMAGSSLGLLPLGTPGHVLSRRAEPFGPAFHIPLQDLICPLDENELSGNETSECETTGWEDDEMSSDSFLEKRDRKRPKPKSFCTGAAAITYQPPVYHTSSTLQTNCPSCVKYGYANPGVCLDFTFSTINTIISDTNRYQTEHVLEIQLLTGFFEWVRTTQRTGNSFPNPQTAGSPSNVAFCSYLQGFWYRVGSANKVSVDGSDRADPIELVAQVWPGADNQWNDELMLVDKGVNNCKGAMFGTGAIRRDSTMQGYIQSVNKRQKAFQNLKDCMMALRYLRDPIVSNTLLLQKNRVRDRLSKLDNTVVPSIVRPMYNTWTPQSLAQLWDTFMSQKAIQARAKAETHISTWIGNLKNAYATPAQRQSAAQGTTALDQANARFIAKIDKLEQEWNAQGQWSPPF